MPASRGPAVVAAVLLLAGLWPDTAQAQSSGEKLKRGVANLTLGVLEIPATIVEESRSSNPVQGVFVGLVKGSVRFVRRELAGAYELVTFPVETPAGYEKLVEPEYSWEYFE